MATRRHGRRAQGRVAQPGTASVLTRVLGVLGELLITFGVLVLAFVAWQLWIQDATVSTQQGDRAAALSRQWASKSPSHADPQGTKTPPAASTRPSVGQAFGVLHIPRLGAGWSRPLIGGTTIGVLNKLGAGWYPQSSLPGQIGNTAFASHRGGHGSNFRYLDTLRYGDIIVLETEQGWYVYDYRNTEYVMDTAVSVVNPVPQSAAAPKARLLTLTTCNPYPFTNGERMIVYSTFRVFYPRDGGLPASLSAQLQGGR